MLEDKLTPDETGEQNQQLVRYLQRVHDTRVADTQSRARIRERLLQNRANAIPNIEHITGSQPDAKTRSQSFEENNIKRIYARSGRRTRRSRLNAIAAVVLVALLVSSLVLLLHYRQTDLGNGAGTFQLRQAWTQIALYSGTGSKTISGLDIEPAPVWGYTDTCSGNGDLNITMTGVQLIMSAGDLPCQPGDATRIAPQTISFALSPVKLQTIKVTASASMVWHIQIVQKIKQPALRIGSEWVQSTGMGGNGSGGSTGNVINPTKPGGQMISPRTWGVVLICIGTGKGYIQLTPTIGRILMPPCDGQPRLDVIHYPVATTIQEYQASVTGDIVWQAQIVGCIDEHKCGTGPASNVSPTSVPTASSSSP